MEADAGLTHEAVVCPLQLHIAQALRSGIQRLQCSTNRHSVLRWNQGISCSAQTNELSLHLGQQLQGGRTSSRPHSADARSIEIKGHSNSGQRGRQKCGMPPEAEAHHMDGSELVVQLVTARKAGGADALCLQWFKRICSGMLRTLLSP